MGEINAICPPTFISNGTNLMGKLGLKCLR